MSIEKLNLLVAKKAVIADSIISIELVDPEQRALPAFSAGSHIDVYLANGLTRQYSLWNNPNETHRYCLGVLKEESGRGGSAAMHNDLSEGDRLEISHPRNSFHLKEEAEHTILFAGGIGITPILAMAQRLLTLGKSFEMHYCSRTQDRMAFYDMLSNSPFEGLVHFHCDDGPKEQLLDINALVGEVREGTELYVCGPQGFMDYVIGTAEKKWPASSIHREYFSIDPNEGHDDDQGFEVKIASTGDVYKVSADKTIAEVLNENGHDVPISCEQGVCGTCLTRVVGGEPEHRDVYLSPSEQAENNQMTVCCSRSKSAMLELDL